ncbi:fibronectin type III domain-containing protein [Micromonospora sp. NPDC005291]|uniref:fibronectin type III domain-containing protein n=1 Tax=Micromonospora sp. NPDC005291 TaxID=3156872 RepID=UPI0033B32FFC
MVVSRPAAGSLPAGGMSAAAMNSMFTAYGNAGGHWTGGDGTASVVLPDGRVVWLFADSFLGTVNADGSRPTNSPMVNNVMVVQDSTSLTTTLHGGTTQWPSALVKPEESGEFLWSGDGTVEGNTLKVIYNRLRSTGSGALDFQQTGVELATFSLPDLTMTSLVDLPLGPKISWGAGIFPDGEWTYIYGLSSAPGRMKFAHLARVPAGGLSGTWEFWTGTTWSTDLNQVGRVISGVDGGGVQKVGSQYVWVSHENNLLFDPQFVAYTSTSPTGPFSGPIQLFTAPEPQTQGLFVYNARVHPELARDGKLLVSYDVNDFTPGGTYGNVTHGRPRFVEVYWPRPAPGTGVPPTPAAPTLVGQGDRVQVSWPAVSGATSYRVYQRTVSGGQTHFARLPEAATSTSKEAGFLIPGHTYEFKVSAVNANGEGPASSVRTVVLHNTKPVSEAIGGTDLPSAVAGSYIVQLRETTPEYAVADYARELATQYGGQSGRVFPRLLRGFSATLTQGQAHDLAGHPDVARVEQNQTGRALGVQPNPPSWGLDRIDQRDNSRDQRYEYPNDGSVDVYVLDSGVRVDHDTFGGRAEHGYNAFADEGIPADDCGVGHGTHVAGTVGGAGHGVAKGASITSVKVLHCTGPEGWPEGDVDDVISGLEWVISQAQGPAVVNMSIGFWRLPFNSPLDTTVQRAVDAGLTVVAAAGNTDEEADLWSPARVDAAITVGATTQSDARWGRSNYGPDLDLFAPGDAITSAGIGSTSATEAYSGSSMAAAHVSGAAAMILDAHPGYGPEQVQRLMINAATTGVVSNAGTGSPNRLLYIERLPTQAPTNLAATGRPDGTISLDWDPIPDQGAHYVVYYRDTTAGQPEPVEWDQRIFDGNEAVFGLGVEGHTFEFQVAAANGAGIGPKSPVATATVDKNPPAAPTGLTASPQPDGTIKLTWTSTPGLWHYVYLRDLNAEGGPEEFHRLEWPVSDGPQMTLGGLKHNHQYEAYVTTFDDAGESQPSNIAGATAKFPLPPAPTNLVATAGDRQVTLRWATAGEGVWYRIHMRNVTAGETQFTALAWPVNTCCSFLSDGLTNGSTYEYRVTAIGADGAPDSLSTNTVRVTPIGLPAEPPSNLVATPGNAQVSLTWTPSSQPDAWYWIEMRPAGGTWQRLELPVTSCCEFASIGLTNGTTYEYRVRTIGANGNPDSVPTNVASARPAAPPTGAPSNLIARAGNARVDLTWTASSTAGAWYWIEMRPAGGTWQRLGLPVTTCCTFASTALTNGQTYEYRVVTVGAAGAPDSAPSNIASARPVAPTPAPPTNLRATAGNARVDLTWTASSTPGAWYWIEMRNVSAGQSSWQRLELPVSTCCSFASTQLTNGDRYEYRIRAVGGGGAPDSAASNTVSARPVAPQPAPPTNLTATAGNGKVTLKWAASSTPGVWYWVYYRDATAQQSWRKYDLPVSTCCSFVAGYLTNGQTYEYRVAAIGTGGAPDSSLSNIASARPMPPFPQPPTQLTSLGGDNEAYLSWKASPTAGVVYNVYMRTRYHNSYGSWIKLKLPATSTSMTAGYLQYGYTYEFKVAATNISGESVPSNTTTVLIVPESQANQCVSANTTVQNLPYNVPPVQYFNDIVVKLCGQRSNFTFALHKSWRVADNVRLETSTLWYQLFDCNTGVEVTRDIHNYPSGSSSGSWSASSYHGLWLGHLYRVRVSGYGHVRKWGIQMKFSANRVDGLIPFEATSRCF